MMVATWKIVGAVMSNSAARCGQGVKFVSPLAAAVVDRLRGIGCPFLS
jgi:hypothetical protein